METVRSDVFREIVIGALFSMLIWDFSLFDLVGPGGFLV